MTDCPNIFQVLVKELKPDPDTECGEWTEKELAKVIAVVITIIIVIISLVVTIKLLVRAMLALLTQLLEGVNLLGCVSAEDTNCYDYNSNLISTCNAHV